MNSGAVSFPLPEIDAVNGPYWAALRDGKLIFQRCDACETAWLPPRSECPHCLAPQPGWGTASGRAKLISWVVYHVAFNPAFKHRLPYTVAVVELAEGPRLISNIVGIEDPETLHIDQGLHLLIEDEHGVAVPRFRPE